MLSFGVKGTQRFHRPLNFVRVRRLWCPAAFCRRNRVSRLALAFRFGGLGDVPLVRLLRSVDVFELAPVLPVPADLGPVARRTVGRVGL